MAKRMTRHNQKINEYPSGFAGYGYFRKSLNRTIIFTKKYTVAATLAAPFAINLFFLCLKFHHNNRNGVIFSIRKLKKYIIKTTIFALRISNNMNFIYFGEYIFCTAND